MDRASKKQLVAIVDDDESIREATAGLLKAFGLQTEVFSSAEEFLVTNHLQNTACLILDIRMTGLSGLHLQRQLASVHQQLPIIFITAHGSDEAEAQAMRRGAVAFLRKPFSAADMFQSLQIALDASRNEETTVKEDSNDEKKK